LAFYSLHFQCRPIMRNLGQTAQTCNNFLWGLMRGIIMAKYDLS
jgi:hypothetical protein